MSVVSAAKHQVANETSAATRTAHAHTVRGSKGPRHIDGNLVWFGEYSDSRELHPYKVTGGDKQLMSLDEKKRFAHTPYESGILEYTYEGSIKVMRQGAPQPTDPRYFSRDGNGAMKYALGELYDGGWRNGKRHGLGVFRSAQGYTYTGDWADDIMEGKGRETFTCNAVLECQYEGGLPTGAGVLWYQPKHSQLRYEGEFLHGKRHGKGIMFYENGDTFAGTWDSGKRHGRGVTTNANGRQYESEWEQDTLTGHVLPIERARRTLKPTSTTKFSAQSCLLAADLTKWKVKDDVVDLPLEHFFRIKLGFELLDRNASGSLSTDELLQIWPSDGHERLMKLDADGNGTVELDEIFAAWYPSVPPHNINRFMQQDLIPRDLLRIRGRLCEIVSDHGCGYQQVVRAPRDADPDADLPLSVKHLEAAAYKIGFEKFTLAMYESAKALCDPPHFLEVLEVWYPNIPRTTLEHYELTEIPEQDLSAIRSDFLNLSGRQLHVNLSDFEDAQDRYQHRLASGAEANDEGERSEIELCLTEGFFRGQPIWNVGSIRVSVQLLRDITLFDTRLQGQITLHALLRYCFPNVPCKRTKELLKKQPPSGVPCSCQICQQE